MLCNYILYELNYKTKDRQNKKLTENFINSKTMIWSNRGEKIPTTGLRGIQRTKEPLKTKQVLEGSPGA